MIQFQRPEVLAPDGSIIGAIVESGELTAAGAVRIKVSEPLPDERGNFVLEHALAQSNAVAKARAVSHLLALRRAGATLVLISHDETLLENTADEIWWIRDGQIISRGDPGEVLTAYRTYVAGELRKVGQGIAAPLAPTIRNGDGRAALEAVELIAASGESSAVFRSGEEMSIRVTARYSARVEKPVLGILIRTRIGLNVYGTNTELEHLNPGPVEAGDRLRVTYSFQCDLCPGDYTVTAASHDPDGLWHDWQEDAVAFAVSDARYTAGVANLRARVWVERQRQSASV